MRKDNIAQRSAEELTTEELSRVTGGANWLHLEVPDTYIYVGPVHK